ncbi:MAG: flagellar hook-basal body complex protein FliE [Veillonellales bacterium]
MGIAPLKLLPVQGKSTSESGSAAAVGTKDFGQFLTDALNDVNKLQNDSAQASLDLAAGKIQDISQVTIAAEKATIALQLTMQVRNKVVDAYQEVMRMQV